MAKVVTEREIVTELLRQFKNSPCLWDTTHASYFNKEARKKQYQIMLNVYRQLDPFSTVETLKKKLEHYRAGYRRERKKVENSTMNGGSPDSIHQPTLWYYNLLTFLSVKPNHSSDEDDNTPLREIKKRRISLTDKVKKEKLEDSRQDHSSGNWDTPDYITSYAESIARQLKELDEPVRYEAERIISDVIYRARTGTLPKYSSEVVDTLMIPQFGPSWYDVADQGDVQEPKECLVVTLAHDAEQPESPGPSTIEISKNFFPNK
ncbi:unnamed protein product [Arctia plantaginis]|uniref:MADF domain-containing protein n=1 Tax=Arctia plantaginis TaxID=874455 RepID=A0A8S1AID5_ARCPL|nr:unnamed protein product [Arctia plantaginis]